MRDFFKSIFTRQINFLVLGFCALRILSFFTYDSTRVNQIFAALFIGIFISICKRNLAAGWTVLVGEFLIDGAGHFFEFQTLILRTWFLGIFGLFWLWQKIKTKKVSLPESSFTLKSMLAVGLVLVWAALNGFLKDHSPLNIFQDAILYGFLLLLFPALEYKEKIRPWFTNFLQTYLIGSALFSLFSFFWYSSHLGILRDTYYHWYRNIVAGKITDLGYDFFRIVLSEHLFIVPILLVLTALLIQDVKNKKLWFFTFLSAIILALNFSRIYFVALAAGMLILKFKHPLKQWFKVCTLVTITIFLTFSSLYFLASRGQSIGLELLGVRLSGTTLPQNETSGAIRLAILPDALRTIKTHLWLGSGLGATVTYIDPTTRESVTRTQFDWGYLEVLAELGIMGTTIFIFFLLGILFQLAKVAYKKTSVNNTEVPLLRGLLAGAFSLFLINATTPALFQGFGILYFVFLLLALPTSPLDYNFQKSHKSNTRPN